MGPSHFTDLTDFMDFWILWISGPVIPVRKMSWRVQFSTDFDAVCAIFLGIRFRRPSRALPPRNLKNKGTIPKLGPVPLIFISDPQFSFFLDWGGSNIARDVYKHIYKEIKYQKMQN